MQDVCYLAQPSFFMFFTQGHFSAFDFSLKGHFSAFDFSLKVMVNSFHVGICQVRDVNENWQIT